MLPMPCVDSQPLNEQPRILIIEDQPDLLDLIYQSLAQESYEILSDLTPLGGLELALREKPDLILLDVMMPQMNGYQLCAKLRADERTRKIPVIFLTAMDRVEHVVKGLDCGACDYVTKPFDFRELRARVRAALRTRGERHTHLRLRLERQADQSLLSGLTGKEVEVLREICQGLSNKEIAKLLGVSPFTIKNHVSNIFRKLHTSSRTEAAHIGIKAHLV